MQPPDSSRATAGPKHPKPQEGVPGPRDVSFVQQSLWFLDQFAPGSLVYNIAATINLAGALDVAALEGSLHAIIRRHEALRSGFTAVDGQPYLVVAQDVTVPLTLVDLRGLRGPERENEVRRLVVVESRRPFDLARGPLLRITLLRLGEREHLLVLAMHQIISDDRSIGLFFRELAALYSAFSAGLPAPLPDLRLQYADFARWQHERLQGERFAARLAYWRQQLAGAPPVLPLPTDRPYPAVQTFEGATHTFQIARPLAESLRALSRQEQIPLLVTLLAAFLTLLWRYTGQDDLVVGTPVVERPRPEMEELIGCFVNTLALRADMRGPLTFRALLLRGREVVAGAYANQDLPFERVVEELHPDRSLIHTPLFQVLFMFQGAPPQPVELPGLAMRLLEIDSVTTHFDLALALSELPEGLSGRIEYKTGLFDPTTIARAAGHFRTLLEGVSADPDRRIAHLPLLTADERRQLLVEWNATAADYPQGQRIHTLFAAQAACVPDAIALVFDRPTTEQGSGVRGQGSATAPENHEISFPIPDPRSPILGPWHLTYRELDRRANRLAHHLQALGVGPEVLAGVCLDRSIELIVALLGVLKTGGAYVPLDPTYPPDRLALMLEDARAPVLLTRRGLLEHLPAGAARVLYVDDLGNVLDQAATDTGPSGGGRRAVTDNLAYVLFTSGSTGRPKGVACPHRGVLNLLADFDRRAPIGVGDGAALWTSVSFDVSVFEIFSALLAGATLHIVPDDVRSDSVAFPAWLDTHQIRSSYVPPFLLHALAALLEHDPARFPLRRLVVGVEPIPEQLLATFATRGVRILNGYGPTETTVCSTLYDVPPAPAHERTTPIGRPLQNTAIYLLDRALEPVPIGVPGEVYIGGAGMARGYLNSPDLTAERFLPNPFADQRPTTNDQRPTAPDPETRRHGDKETSGPGGTDDKRQTQNSKLKTQNSDRLYRTGDLARYLADGNLEFLGRIDQQVKVRGFRVELGEIEEALAQHPAVRDAVVVAREDVLGERRLVAYVVLDQRPTTNDQRPTATDPERGSGGDTETGETTEPQSSVLSPQSSAPRSSFVVRRSSLVAELRAFLKERLPEYMVPSAFVMLDAMPLTPSAKVDRRALASLDALKPALDTAFVPPRTPVEATLAQVWAELLGIERVGVHDNFFEIGGHSLLVTQAISRVRDAFHVELPMRHLFETPTVAGLAESIETIRWMVQGAASLPGAGTDDREEGEL